MYLSLNWINDHVDISGIDVKQLVNRLTMATAEVEEVVEMGKDIQNVVVGKVVEVNDHPESKKLHIVKVDDGTGIVQCVCGAPNVKVGILAPFAKVGGSVKGLSNIGTIKLAGVESNGMLCSAKELGISDDHSGLLILDDSYKPGTNIKKIIDIDDVIIEIDNKTLTNRPDLWGHYGFAREIAALFSRKLKPLPIEDVKNDLPSLKIDIQDKEKCYRYCGITIDNINKKVSPINMQTRLYYCGMRPINLLVDLSNYIMLEISQPTHAFDKNFIKKIEVKSSNKSIEFITLDGAKRTIPEDVLMIHNQDGPVAIAGIMGGENTEISNDTNSVFLESATFDGPSTRKNAVRIGLRTEASARYEKMLDPELSEIAIKRFVKLIKDIDEGAVVSSALTDAYVKKYDSITIKIDKSYIVKYMGKDIGLQKMVDILRSIQFDVKVNGEELEIKVPSFRATKDISIKSDIVEEIARIYGYDNIEPASAQVILKPLQYNEQRLLDHKIQDILSEGNGLSEVHSYIWYDNKGISDIGISNRDGIKIVNSLEGENITLRDCMAPTLLNFTANNVKSFDKFGIYEIGSIFNYKNDELEQHKNLCILLADKNKDENELFYKLKGIVTSIFRITKNIDPIYSQYDNSNYDWTHPIKAAEIKCNGEKFGYITVIHPKVRNNIDKKLNIALVELNVFKLNDIQTHEIKYVAPIKYQEVTFDINILVDKDKSFEQVDNEFVEFKDDLLLNHKFIDLYTGKGIPENKKSMTFSFRIGSKDHTLSSEEIETFRKNLIQYAESKGYSLR